MNWITIIWSMSAGASILLCLLHLTIWIRDRSSWTNLTFAIAAAGSMSHAYLEIRMMYATSPAEFLWAIRLLQIPTFVVMASMVAFIRIYLNAGSWWLAGATVGSRFVSLVINFMTDHGINYQEIHSLRHVTFLGETISLPDEVVTGLVSFVPAVSFPLWFIFVVNATIRGLRRRESIAHRRAIVVGIYFTTALSLCLIHVVLVMREVIDQPIISSMFFAITMCGMSIELSRDVLEASRLAQNLRDTEQRLSLAASAAKIALWEWNTRTGQLWLSSEGKAVFGIDPEDTPTLKSLASRLLPKERYKILLLLDRAIKRKTRFTFEHQIKSSNGPARWLEASGGAETDALTGDTLLRGVSIDVTKRRNTESELVKQREHLSHTLRVASMSQIASSLAHEINQPLAAVANNATAARLMIEKNSMSEKMLSEILVDIIDDTYRAGEVITAIRGMTKRQPGSREEVDMNEIAAKVRRMLAPEALARDCELIFKPAPQAALSEVNVVQIQQVLINLLMNAFESFNLKGAEEKHTFQRRVVLEVVEDDEAIIVKVRDHGPGFSEGGATKCFEPFHTTKTAGLGMGLAISRDLIEEHGGILTAENADGGGALFCFRIPILELVETFGEPFREFYMF